VLPTEAPEPIISTPEKAMDPVPAFPALAAIVNNDALLVMHFGMPITKVGFEQVGWVWAIRPLETVMLWQAILLNAIVPWTAQILSPDVDAITLAVMGEPELTVDAAGEIYREFPEAKVGFAMLKINNKDNNRNNILFMFIFLF